MLIRKAVIPAAGLGTRMLPAAKAVPKELLPILDTPTIQYVVQEAADAGIDDALLIVSREKKALEDHFDRREDLEARLRASGKSEMLASINRLIEKVKVHSVHQSEQLGLGHAVNQSARHIGNEPFLCMLGDTIFSGDVLPAEQLVAAYDRLGTTLIGLEEVPADRVDRYGIVGGEMISARVMRIDRLVEKPARDSAPSRFAIAARYILTPGIFACLDETPRGRGGEIQLTDALQLLAQRETIHGIVLDAGRHDIGNPLDWLATNLIFARQDAALWKQIAPLVRLLLGE